MEIWELAVTALGLSADAFAVAVCKGLSIKKTAVKNSLVVGTWFGGFQALMPLIGYFLASLFAEKIRAFDHWIAFALLVIIGGEMIIGALSKKEDGDENPSLSVKIMLPLAIATSIDALAVGVGFAFLEANIWVAIAFIGAITFIVSAVGVKIGGVFGAKFKKKAELAGGIILILIGIKILLEHLGVINF